MQPMLGFSFVERNNNEMKYFLNRVVFRSNRITL